MRYSQTNCHIQVSYFIPSHTWEGFEPRGFKVWNIWIQTIVAGKRGLNCPRTARLARLGITSDRSNRQMSFRCWENSTDYKYPAQNVRPQIGMTNGGSSESLLIFSKPPFFWNHPIVIVEAISQFWLLRFYSQTRSNHPRKGVISAHRGPSLQAEEITVLLVKYTLHPNVCSD